MSLFDRFFPPIPAAEEAKVVVLILLGHSRHCACRLAFGDGECECGCPRRLHTGLWR